jgi:hypothetical protein
MAVRICLKTCPIESNEAVVSVRYSNIFGQQMEFHQESRIFAA